MRKLIACLFITASLAACGGSQTSATDHVQKDLSWLLQNNDISGNVNYCTHGNGNEYTCSVSGTTQGKVFVEVTDDGHSIVERGLNK